MIATFAGYVATYGLIKIAMGNPKPQKVKKEKGQTTQKQQATNTATNRTTAPLAAPAERTLDTIAEHSAASASDLFSGDSLAHDSIIFGQRCSHVVSHVAVSASLLPVRSPSSAVWVNPASTPFAFAIRFRA